MMSKKTIDDILCLFKQRKMIVNATTFEYEQEFKDWFRTNSSKFAYDNVIGIKYGNWKGKNQPDCICKKIDGTYDIVELELYPTSFIRHKHNIEDVDVIYCADDNRTFYPDIPKEINNKIIIVPTRVVNFNYPDKNWFDFEQRITHYINNKNNINKKYKAIAVLGWFGNSCIICKNKIGNKKNSKTLLEHQNCLEKMIQLLKEEL